MYSRIAAVAPSRHTVAEDVGRFFESGEEHWWFAQHCTLRIWDTCEPATKMEGFNPVLCGFLNTQAEAAALPPLTADDIHVT